MRMRKDDGSIRRRRKKRRKRVEEEEEEIWNEMTGADADEKDDNGRQRKWKTRSKDEERK